MLTEELSLNIEKEKLRNVYTKYITGEITNGMG